MTRKPLYSGVLERTSSSSEPPAAALALGKLPSAAALMKPGALRDDAVHHADAVLNLPGASRLPAHDGVVQLVEGEGGAGSSVEGDERDLRDRVK